MTTHLPAMCLAQDTTPAPWTGLKPRCILTPGHDGPHYAACDRWFTLDEPPA